MYIDSAIIVKLLAMASSFTMIALSIYITNLLNRGPRE